jgi:hypothetical protein
MRRIAVPALLLAGLLFAGVAIAQWNPTAGHLQPFGGYRTPLRGATVNVLPDGSILTYGYGMSANEWRAEQDQNDALRLRHGMESGPDPSPRLYDPAAGGWQRIPRAPQCPDGHVYLHTSTVLADGRVLIAGGLCDVARALNDSAPYPPYAGMSIWDPLKRQWQSAPALAQTRIFHTATRMPDGSVLLIGGESDPRLPHGGGADVLASVVRYTAGKLAAGPAMATARAKHSATALPDGRVLVVGGLDDANHPLASAELLDARGQAWRTLPPMHVARYAHTATLLADGRVLVAGGMGEDGRPLRSVELWDPRSDAWSEGAELPVGLYGHAAVRVASGAVLVAGGTWLRPLQGQSSPWAWLWDPHSQAWQLAGSSSPSVGNDAPQPLGMVARPDGGALIFTAHGVLRWSPEAPATDVPAWRSAPVMAPLPGHRVMLVGYLADDFRGLPVARIWNARTDRWSSTGPLQADSAAHPAALALRSGDVLYVTLKSWHELQCHRWSAPTNRWSACGTATLQYLADSHPQMGLLPDGRAFALVNMHEAAVLDEDAMRWTTWRVDWHPKGLTYGAPVHGQQPLATVTDAAGGESFEINDAGARFVHADGSRPTAMLWNAGTGWWDYVLMGRQMGADARRLPDGCAISTYPIALYRPADAHVFPLSDPGFGSTDHVMTVLDDGTVVVAGPGRDTLAAGAGFFHRKASCRGFAPPPPGDRYISPTVAMKPITPPPTAAPPAAKATPPPRQRHFSWDGMGNVKWVILAGLGSWLAYRLLRGVAWPRLRGGYALAARLLLYGGLAIVLMPWVLSLSTCVHRVPKADWERVGSAAREAARVAMTPSQRPCHLIGLWSSTHKGIMRRIELRDDGRYVMTPSAFDRRSTAGFTGRWKVQADKIVWQPDHSGLIDVNRMLEAADGSFQVIEADGAPTRFERIQARPSTQCDKPASQAQD